MAREHEAVEIPDSTRQIVLAHLREVSGKDKIDATDRLANDLGLDSLVKTELLVWIEKEFGFPQSSPDAIQTVQDVLLAACGETAGGGTADIPPPSKRWFQSSPQGARLRVADGRNIAELFLDNVRRRGGRVVLADAQTGVRTFRDVATAAMVLSPVFRKLPGQYLGLMLPAGVTAAVAYVSALLAGKTPVMVNWTLGQRNLVHALRSLDVQRVVTARRLVAKLAADGNDLSELNDSLVFLEDVAKAIPRTAKLLAAAKARLGMLGPLARQEISPVAAVLFTSGSETLPKAVPLTQDNILADLHAVTAAVCIQDRDRLLGMLPPFHSFGLSVTTVLPLVMGLRTCYWPNPTEAAALAAVIEKYRVTLAVGTPTFMGGIARGPADATRQPAPGGDGSGEMLRASVRLAGAGLPPRDDSGRLRHHGVLADRGDQRRERPATRRNRQGAAGRRVGHRGRGRNRACGRGLAGRAAGARPTIFGGYLNYDGPSPFVELESKQWYRTGDLVKADAGGTLTFLGRLKRFAKLGGEMISLPAIEAVLEAKYAADDDKGPVLAVQATPDVEHPELVLFVTKPVSREEANRHILAAGLSPLHNIRRVIQLDALPLLGTGKIDYRALTEKLRAP